MHRLTLLLGCCLLSACGQKGPLYLPDQIPPARPYSACDLADAPCRKQQSATARPDTPVQDNTPTPEDPERHTLTLDPGSLPAEDATP